MPEMITVVGNAPFPDIPRGRAVTVERTRRINGLLASGRISRVDAPGPDPNDVPSRIEDVKRWVTGDSDVGRTDRAQVALDVERARTAGPRTTLEPWLVDATAPTAVQEAASGEMAGPPDASPSDDAAALTRDPGASG